MPNISIYLLIDFNVREEQFHRTVWRENLVIFYRLSFHFWMEIAVCCPLLVLCCLSDTVLKGWFSVIPFYGALTQSECVQCFFPFFFLRSVNDKLAAQVNIWPNLCAGGWSTHREESLCHCTCSLLNKSLLYSRLGLLLLPPKEIDAQPEVQPRHAD